MQTINFEPRLVPLLYPKGGDQASTPVKYATWRLGDDKSYFPGEKVLLTGRNGVRGDPIAAAIVLDSFRKPYADLTPDDRVGHETYAGGDDEWRKTFQGYYPHINVGLSTEVTVARLCIVAYIIETTHGVVLIEPDFDNIFETQFLPRINQLRTHPAR